MNILTFDIEDWFHILDNDPSKSENDWNKFDSRIQFGLEKILNILNENDVKATFFVLGWVAKKHPTLIKKINELGYEVGTHSHMHQLVYEQSPQQFKEDIKRSIYTIEDCIGKKVTSYRAPGFSITKNQLWAFEILSELGIKIDCSVFPSNRAHGGMPGSKINKPCLIIKNNCEIKEFPINTANFLGKSIIFSGGGYFRIFDYRIIRFLAKKSDYLMTYFHPRDFDYNQPVMDGLSYLRIFKSYVGLSTCYNKLDRFIKDFDFIDLRQADSITKWEKADKVYL